MQNLPDDLLAEIDDALEDVLTADLDGTTATQEMLVNVNDGLSDDPGIRQMQETFLEIIRQNLAPIARYIKAISLGENARELIEISELIVTPLLPRVEQVGLAEHAEELSFFRSLLLLALGERDPSGSKAMREVVMEGFSKLANRYDLRFRGYQLAVRNLVEFYRAVRSSDKVSEADVRRFFAIGVPSLTWVRRTRVSEMTSLSGITPEAMTQIRHLAYQYRSVAPLHGARLARENTIIPFPEHVGRSEVATSEVSDAAIDAVGSETHAVRGSA
ncbi:MAG: hypothetical protein V1495_01815 [Pseudomonadota bacterium]